MSKIIIRGGQIVSPYNTIIGDVLIDDEKIAGITAPNAVQWSDARQIDAAGCYVLPGVVDAHTHIQLDTGVYKTDDNWEIGTKCAAYGGVTTVIDFATQFTGQTFPQALQNRLEECKPAVIDYGLHMMVTDLSRDPHQAARDLAELRDLGVPSIKLYTTYKPNYYADDATLLHTFRAMPSDMLAMVHCENDDIVADATRRLVEEGKTGWRYHGQSRPEEAETEAAVRVVQLARLAGAWVYIVHCSSPHTAAALTQEREAGDSNFYFETCIQYLILDDSQYSGKKPEHFILQPPLRPLAEHHPLFAYYEFDEIDVLSTDHCDYSLAQKRAQDDFRTTPGGLPGLETLLPLSYSVFMENSREGWQAHSLTQLVSVLCANPAKLFGLYPQKGILQPGSDADVIIYDPAPEVTISIKDLHYVGGYTPYEGMKVQGKVRTTISRGMVVVDEGRFVGKVGRGQFVKGQPFKPLEHWT